MREAAGHLALRTAGRLNRRTYLGLEYPPSARSAPRYGHGRPVHAALRDQLALHHERYRAELLTIASLKEDLLAIPARDTGTAEPAWLNAFLLGLDTASLYAILRSRGSRRYVEVGSGNSTLVAHRARRDGSLPTHITSIDPQPRVGIDAVCDTIVRKPLETADLGVFSALEAGDVVFMDGSHRVFTNSDATVFFLDVLPALRPGVVVGVHDVFLPEDYLPEWSDWHFSEQYLLAAYLLAGGPRIVPLLPCFYAGSLPELSGMLDGLWTDPRLADVDRRGFVFWFEVGPAR